MSDSVKETLEMDAGDDNDKIDKMEVLKSVSAEQPEQVVKLSKKQLRRLAKKEKWEQLKPMKRQMERQKKKERKLKRKQSGNTEEPSRKALKSNAMKDSKCKVGIAIDMGFDDLMSSKDLNKCVKQIHRCYSLNRRLKDPVQYYVTNFTGASKSIITKHDGWNNWDVHFTEKTHMEIEAFPKSNVVYLTSESENVLDKLEDGTLYVIGGLVDHNSKKGLCHSLAQENKLKHARLPITEYMLMKTRKVLSIDHVFEIITLVTQGFSWEESLVKVLPQRKEAVPIMLPTEEESSQDTAEGDI